MNELLKTAALTFDPRGRCNRRGLLYVMGITLTMQVVIAIGVVVAKVAFVGPIAMAVKLTFLWIAISATVQRLHDTGRSGWWLAGAFVFLVVWMALMGVGLPILVATTWGPQLISFTSPAFYAILMLSYAPILGGALWLHFAVGERVDNRYGPVPGASGFSQRSNMRGQPSKVESPPFTNSATLPNV
ncbi:MAG: DUF805 domain-containing protein [Pseudomonadota bacterium]